MDGLLFPDLLIKYSSGYQYPLRVKQGEYIPIEIFDPLDIQKSLLTGSLGSFIRGNSVSIEYSDIELKQQKKQTRKKKVIEISKPEQIIQPPIEAPTVAEQPQVVEQTDAENAPAYIDFKDVLTVEDFLKLGYFRRLEFIKQCNDTSLLTQLSDKIESANIKALIYYRLHPNK
jgi:hypothetical protein